MAKNLGKHFHSSCPTSTPKVKRLYHAIKKKNNLYLEIVFIPQSYSVYISENICVYYGSMAETLILNKDGNDE